MKKVMPALLISLFLLSCHKEKMLTIAGSWEETGNYVKSPSGAFYWEPASRFPLTMVLQSNGEYYSFNDVPAGNGVYEYNSSTKELKMTYSASGSMTIYTISFLDENYMIMDYTSNSELRKIKFSR